MSEAEQQVEEPDTPEESLPEELTVALLLDDASELSRLTREIKRMEVEAAKCRQELLANFENVSRDLEKGGSPPLHGIRLKNGDAIRRVWTTSQSKIDPAKLRESLADAPNYIRETVDAVTLRKDYESVWRALAKAKSRQTIAVRLTGEK